MKKTVRLALSLIMVLGLLVTGCAAGTAPVQPVAETTPQPTAEAALYQAGTYVGSGNGRNGAVQVSVTFSDTEMLSAEVSSHAETAGIADVPVERLPLAVVENQSLAVDVITGATLTSNAILDAIANTIEQAGGDVDAFKAAPLKATAAAGQTIEKAADVVIVGGGGAGMAAAISAAQGGASVIILEKTTTLGGNTVRSGGAYNAVDPERQALTTMTDAEKATVEKYITLEPHDDIEAELQSQLRKEFDDYLASGATGLFDSITFHTLQTYAGGDYMGDIALIRTLCAESPETLKWLESNGFTWKPGTFTIVGATWARSHESADFKSGLGFIDALNRAAADYPIEFLFETPATELITDASGAVTGVKASAISGDEYVISAKKGVILASGGFGANMEMVRQYRPNILETTPTTNSPAVTGDGIQMAAAVNAQLVDMELIQLYPLASALTGDTAYGMVGPTTAMYVNPKGERYVNEYERRDVLAQAAFDQGGVIYCISDSEANKMRDPEQVQYAIDNGAAYKADTLEELATLLGMDPAVLVETVNKFNQYADEGYDPDFGRTSFDSNVKILTGPFYASPRSPSIHHTMGGIKVDLDAHVISTDGNIIPGLFAAGEVTGDIHGNNRLGGNAVPDALTFGRIAGASVAK